MFVACKMLQQGYNIAYQADAIVYHSHSYSLSQEFKRYFDMGKFHTQEQWILDDFGKAEGEGKKFVISEIKYLVKNGNFYLLPLMVIRTAFKFLGYKIGSLHIW
jgi:rhamnosyltransferase